MGGVGDVLGCRGTKVERVRVQGGGFRVEDRGLTEVARTVGGMRALLLPEDWRLRHHRPYQGSPGCWRLFSLSLTHTHTLSISRTHTHTLFLSVTHTLSLCHTHTPSISLSHTSLSVSLSHTHSLSLSLTHTLSLSHRQTHTHSLSHALTPTLSLLLFGCWRCPITCTLDPEPWTLKLHPKPESQNSKPQT